LGERYHSGQTVPHIVTLQPALVVLSSCIDQNVSQY